MSFISKTNWLEFKKYIFWVFFKKSLSFGIDTKNTQILKLSSEI